MQCDANEQSENMNYNKVHTVTTMNQTDCRKPCYQIFFFIVELHTNTEVVIAAANSEALLCFLLYISTLLNNYLSEKCIFLIFVRLQKICFWSSFSSLETVIDTFWRLVQWNLTKSWHFGLLVFIQVSKN